MLLGSLAARQLLPFGLAHWQVMFLVGALPALLCVPLLRHLKEPPSGSRHVTKELLADRVRLL